MPEPVRPAQINVYKQKAHNDGCDGKQFTKNYHVVKVLVVVNIGGYDEHHRGCCEPDNKGKIGNINSPGDLIGHVGYGKAVDSLLGIRVEPDQGEDRKNSSSTGNISRCPENCNGRAAREISRNHAPYAVSSFLYTSKQ